MDVGFVGDGGTVLVRVGVAVGVAGAAVLCGVGSDEVLSGAGGMDQVVDQAVIGGGTGALVSTTPGSRLGTTLAGLLGATEGVG